MLTETERAVLDLEGEGHASPAAKEELVRTRLELSIPRYYQVLGRLLDRPEAHEYAPMLVARLRRLRDRREAERTGGADDGRAPGAATRRAS